MSEMTDHLEMRAAALRLRHTLCRKRISLQVTGHRCIGYDWKRAMVN